MKYNRTLVESYSISVYNLYTINHQSSTTLHFTHRRRDYIQYITGVSLGYSTTYNSTVFNQAVQYYQVSSTILRYWRLICQRSKSALEVRAYYKKVTKSLQNKSKIRTIIRRTIRRSFKEDFPGRFSRVFQGKPFRKCSVLYVHQFLSNSCTSPNSKQYLSTVSTVVWTCVLY